MAALFLLSAFPVFIRSLPAFVVATVSFLALFFSFLSVENFQLKKNSPKKSTATCVLAVAQPPAITVGSAKSFALNQGTLTLILIFSVPFHAHSSSTSLVPRSFPALWWLSVPQHRHSFSKKSSLQAPLFLLHLGCLLLE